MYDDIHPSSDITKAIHRPNKNWDFKLLSTYSEAWNEYTLYVQRLRRRNGLPMGFLRVIEKDQRELMTALKREYHVNWQSPLSQWAVFLKQCTIFLFLKKVVVGDLNDNTICSNLFGGGVSQKRIYIYFFLTVRFMKLIYK